MIPKIIHYCWFGGKPFPRKVKKCIKSWSKFCPDYEIREWNESNYHLQNAPLYVRQAYENKRYAFVSDYVRLDVVNQYGGIYLDVDIKLIKSLDSLLEHRVYFGLGTDGLMNTGLGFGSEANNIWLQRLMDDYKNISFIKEDGSLNLWPCPRRNSQTLGKYGFKEGDKLQILDDLYIYPSQYFDPLGYPKKKLEITPETYSIHLYMASWHTWKQTYWEIVKKIRRLRGIE